MKKFIALVAALSLLAIAADNLNAQGGTTRAVTQITSIATPVTINSSTGVITTVAATVAGQQTATFTVNNSAVGPLSTVSADIQGYSGTYGTNGLPFVTVGNVAAGSFTITLANAHGANALSGTISIGFIVM
jgi:hypothetical protein